MSSNVFVHELNTVYLRFVIPKKQLHPSVFYFPLHKGGSQRYFLFSKNLYVTFKKNET